MLSLTLFIYLCKVKKILFISLFLLLSCRFLWAAKNDIFSNDSIAVDSTKVSYFYQNFDNQYLGKITEYDTTTLSASFYDPVNTEHEIYQTLSNPGLAHKKLGFHHNVMIGFNNRLPAFNNYIKTEDDIIYPIIYQPFTEIRYMMGGKKEQHLNLLFSREFLKNLFITINYNIDFAPTVYQYSKAQNTYFTANLRWNTPNQRYGITGYYFHNKIDVQENGGIVDDNVFIDLIEEDKTVIAVNLQQANNLIKVSGFGLNQYFNILSPRAEKKDDSLTTKKRKIELGRINYSFGYQQNKYVYSDKNPLSSFYQSHDTVIDSVMTFDSIYFHTIKNFITWNTLGYKKFHNDIPFYLTLGIGHCYSHHAGYKDLITNEYFGSHDYSDFRVNAGIIINLFKSTRLTGNGELIIDGYHAGDFNIIGEWRQFLGTSNKNIGALVFDLNISRESADWFEESYYSNNFRWNNNFSPTTYLGLAGSYELSWLTLGLKHNTIDHYIYFNNDAKPAQHTGTINISSIFAYFNLKLKHIELSSHLSLQKADNESVVHLPLFYGKLKFGWNITLVKNVSMMQPSITVHYFTNYYADAYMPALRTFYLQDEVKIGNFPYIDLFVTFKVKRVNIFVGYTNLYSLTKDNRYFTTPHYPMRDARFVIGVRWRLYK